MNNRYVAPPLVRQWGVGNRDVNFLQSSTHHVHLAEYCRRYLEITVHVNDLCVV